MLPTKIAVVFSISLIASATAFLTLVPHSPQKQEVIVWVNSAPSSADPLAINFIANQMTFRSVLGTLVSKYRVGSYEPMIAQAWSASTDYRSWTFTIRPDWKFSTGERITPRDIVQSWKRLLFLSRDKNSKNEFLENIVGHKKLLRMDSKVDGLFYDDNSVKISLSKSLPNLLDLISNGTFSVVHPSQYHPQTGLWLNSKAVISSSAYEVTDWDQSTVRLKLRSDNRLKSYHANLLDRIVIQWGKDNWGKADISLGHSINIGNPNEFEFHGGPLSGIVYVRCHSWTLKSSICNDEKMRHELRNAFYGVLKDKGLNITNTFFPGSKYIDAKIPSTTASGASIQSSSLRSFSYLISSSQLNPYFKAYGATLEQAAGRIGLRAEARKVPVEQILKDNTPNGNHYAVDFSIRATELDFSSIHSELISMFLDAHGLQLPDQNGNLKKLIQQNSEELERYNEIIAKEGLIWPLSHFSQGLLARKGWFDLSQVNLLLPPLEFQWIGWR